MCPGEVTGSTKSKALQDSLVFLAEGPPRALLALVHGVIQDRRLPGQVTGLLQAIPTNLEGTQGLLRQHEETVVPTLWGDLRQVINCPSLSFLNCNLGNTIYIVL